MTLEEAQESGVPGNLANTPSSSIPLVIDVDRTLIRTDILHEAVFWVVARHPLAALQIPFWRRAGRSVLADRLASYGDAGVAAVPFRDESVALIRAAQADGQPVYLASASHHRYVEILAERLGGIAGVLDTRRDDRLADAATVERLVAAFGRHGFDYLGCADVDVPVWRAARKVLALAHTADFERRLLAALPDAQIVARPRVRLEAYLDALRPLQWAKNTLVVLPLVAGHYFDVGSVLAAGIAFAAFSLAASSAYLLNDLLDLPVDRAHRRKCARPFAAGRLPIAHGAVLAAALILGAFGLAAWLPLRFIGILAVYLATTLAYSLILRRKVVLDVVVLGCLYTLRVLGGIYAIGSLLSPWLLMFCLFLFLSLAIVKRCSELIAAGSAQPSGRDYRPGDLNVLFPFGAAAGYGAVFVVALYMSSPEVRLLYTHQVRLWLICPLLVYWISRIFVLSSRGVLHDDPVVFALTDRASWLTAACVFGVLLSSL